MPIGNTGITNVQTALTDLCKNSAGLRSITVTDRDGVVVLRAPESLPANDDQTADQILTTIFSLTTEQTTKIPEIGQASFIMSFFDNCMCLQANYLPLVIRIIADKTANAGALIEMLQHVKALLGPTRGVIMRGTAHY
eukprot:TRINITY_DN48577_c0_g1_i1.p1 TRINITY_DN48577_c0_g1~~TRINITY_DN48577_c0_g1_i1.p1  ORF type:complete len:138 (-),score=16.61 TRINITY_DN48577_c0_g1_i1:250-663(-)